MQVPWLCARRCLALTATPVLMSPRLADLEDQLSAAQQELKESQKSWFDLRSKHKQELHDLTAELKGLHAAGAFCGAPSVSAADCFLY